MSISPGVLAPPHEVLTPDEWRARGRPRRRRVALSEHAAWDPPPYRPDPIMTFEEQAKTRVTDLVPIRDGRMLISPFAYYRGAAARMAWDLAYTPATELRVQCCGDAHLLNFGMFAAPDRRLVFDVNNFDETLPAPFEWNVKRRAASLAVAAGDNGFSSNQARGAARRCANGYRSEMARHVTMRFLNVWYSRINVDEVTKLFDAVQPKKAVRQRRKEIRKAQHLQRTSLKALMKFCDQVGGEYWIRPDHPVIVRFPIERNPEMLDELRSTIAQYKEMLPADQREVLRRCYFGEFARKVVGVGSIGTEAFLLLGDRADEPLILQLKEAQESRLAAQADTSEYQRQGERVARGQQVTQAATEESLGWTKSIAAAGNKGHDRYVRQFPDMALAYADQNAKDYQCLMDALANDRARAVMELSGANLQPRLTGPLLPRARIAGPGPAGLCDACLRVGYPIYAAAAPQRLSWA
jgi:uncharacterized protein (DUF2252 family)